MKRVLFLLLAVLPLAACGDDNSPQGFEIEEPENNNNLECDAGELLCTDQCVDPTTTDNCGTCGNACAAGESCVDGACAVQCDEGQVACDGACIDPQTDAAFCGASADCAGNNAGEACGEGQVCQDAACVCVTDAPSFVISEVSGTATEGGDPVTYEVSLGDIPCDTVTVTLTPDAEISLDATELVFTAENWDTPQTVSVTALVDVARDGDHQGVIQHTVASADSAYDGFALDDVTIEITDAPPVWKIGVATDGSEPNGHVYTPVVSDNGRYVAFLSTATNLTSDTYDTENVVRNAFWKDLETGETRLLTNGLNGPADGGSGSIRISSDGQTVAFASAATNLTIEATTPNNIELFVYTVEDGAIDQITEVCSGCDPSMGADVALSGDGNILLFTTRRRYLPAVDTSTEFTVYRYIRSNQDLSIADLNAEDEYNEFYWGSNSFTPTISANGNFMGWTAAARNIVDPDISVENFHSYAKDLTTKTVQRLSVLTDGNPCPGTTRTAGSGAPFLDDSGELALFHTQCPLDGSANAFDSRQVYFWDGANGTNTRITTSAEGLPDAQSSALGISADGRWALYTSLATNLVVTDGPTGVANLWHLYVWDNTTQETHAINYGADYRWSNHGLAQRVVDAFDTDSPHFPASLSRNGQFAAYATTDEMLEPESETPAEFTNSYVVRIY